MQVFDVKNLEASIGTCWKPRGKMQTSSKKIKNDSKMSFLDFYSYFFDKFVDKDYICEGKVGVVKEIVEGIDKVQVFCENLIQAFIPIGQTTFHADKLIERHVYIVREIQALCNTALIKRIPTCIT